MEDLADKFTSKVTASLLILCHAMVTMKQYFSKPIVCYIVDNMPGEEFAQEYVDNYCWVQGTVPIRHGEKFPSTQKEWDALEKRKINYYQWTPIFLLVQCLSFYSSHFLWKLICYYQLGPCAKKSFLNAVRNEVETKSIVSLIGASMKTKHSIPSKWIPLWVCYFACKLYTITNAVLQMWIMQVFLGYRDGTISFGWNMIGNISNGLSWENTLLFPRVAFCVPKIKILGGHINVVGQCVLPINLLNEKIFLFLWCWVTFIAVINVFSIIRWIKRLFIDGTRNWSNAMESVDDQDFQSTKQKELLKHFNYDDVLLLHMLSLNTADIAIMDMIDDIWGQFRNVDLPVCEKNESYKMKDIVIAFPKFGVPK